MNWKSSETNMNSAESTKNKVLLDPSIPIEDLLGSVTTYNNGSESLQLRTSARVFKKMKLDSAQAALPANEKKEPEKKEETKPETKKFTRPFWSPEDKNFFFEALNEYGKDFDAIHSYIMNKLKKKGLPETAIKTREQIRHLYYRTWHKISKYLKFSDDVKKIAQELYCLINYGELRKKLVSLSEKTCVKLNELIYRGTVAIRVKGKTIRIKTPMCKALRRLNQLDEKNDDIKLPNRIIVELRPKNMMTWMKVQEMSQNPRIRTMVHLQKRLSCIISYLAERWKTQDVFEHEKLLQTAEQLTDESITKLSQPLLRLSPPNDSTIAMPTINFSEFSSTQSICLKAYEERIGVKQSGEALWLESYPHLKQHLNKIATKKGVKRPRTESNGEKFCKASPASSSATTTIDSNENCVSDIDATHNKIDEYVDEAVNTILALNQEQLVDDKIDKIEVKDEDVLSQIKREHDIAKLKLGWTIIDCGTLTVGDLYLMYGSESKVILEYGWDTEEKFSFKREDSCEENGIEIKENHIENNNTDNCNDIAKSIDTSTNLTFALKRLLSIAKLHYRKNIVKCPCGHICGTPSKSNFNKNKTTPQKIVIKEGNTLEVQNITSTIIAIHQNNVTNTANVVPITIQPKIKQFSPSSLFRHPSVANDGLRAQLDSIQRLKPRYCNRKGRRPRASKPVVDRKLPLLPNNADPSRQIVQMNLVTQEITRQIAPKIVPQFDINVLNGNTNRTYVETTLTPVSVTSNQENGTYTVAPLEQNTVISADLLDTNATTASRVGSPTSISNLLDIALHEHDNQNGATENTLGATSFEGLLSDTIAVSTPPTSPSRILKENENQWINSEVGDFSFSSFLGHLESPIKPTTTTSTSIGNEDSRLGLPPDVDAQLHSLLTESSLDYAAKFADLAAQVTDIAK